MKVMVADKAGACYGVERALELARRAAEKATSPVHTLGALIHNPAVVAELAREGVSAVDRPEDAEPGSVLVMRAHGVTPDIERRAADGGLVIVDATCPFVKKVHRAVELLSNEGDQVVVVGICGHAPEAVVVGSSAELESLEFGRRVGVVAQTTLERSVLRDVVSALVGRCGELRVIDTICEATRERQQAAAELAAASDVMIVVGGRSSANTRHLADVCARHCAVTHHVESAEELDSAWFEGARTVGITAGASTPAEQIEAVRSALA